MRPPKYFPRFYILVGDRENWETSLEKNIWGFVERSKGLWKKSEINEFLAFYVTKPTKKFIGFGQITEKYIDEELVWPMEKFGSKSIWKYKINFKPFYVVEDIDDGITLKKNLMLISSRTVVSEEIFFELVKEAEQKWNVSLLKELKQELKNVNKVKKTRGAIKQK